MTHDHMPDGERNARQEQAKQRRTEATPNSFSTDPTPFSSSSDGLNPRQKSILNMQRMYGNAAVVRMLQRKAQEGDARLTAVNSTSGLVNDQAKVGVNPKTALQHAPVNVNSRQRRYYAASIIARTPNTSPQASRQVTHLAQMAIDNLDDGGSKILISTVLNAAKLSELPAFAAILRAAPDDDYGDHFVFLIHELEEDFGSRTAVDLLELFADAGVEVTKLNYSLDPLGAVAKFKSTVKRYKALLVSGALTDDEIQRVGKLFDDAEDALRTVEGPRHKGGPQVRQMGAIAAAAGTLWTVTAALAVDDVTAIGVLDDVAIPFVIVGALVLSGIALFTSGPKPQILNYDVAKTKVEAALRAMTDLLGISVILTAAGNVADTGIIGEVNDLIAAAVAGGLTLTVCAALAQLLAAAKAAGDTDRIKRIIATQKAKGCRRSRRR